MDSSLVDVLRYRANAQPDGLAFCFVETQNQIDKVSYGDLDRRARSIASALQSQCRSGDRVILFFPPGLNYIAAFLGTLYAGCVAVPLYPPRPNQKRIHIEGILRGCEPAVVLTDGASFQKVTRFMGGGEAGRPPVIAVDQLAVDAADTYRHRSIVSDDLAFLQYTSGSTGDPKGVMVSHGNLMANQAAIGDAFQTTIDDVCVNWLPMYHDMGLIGTVLHPLWRGFPSILMAPTAFIREPLRWLELLSEYRGTVGGGPNFGFEYCVQRASADRLSHLDLSSWRIAFSGAEPIRAGTLQRFSDTFSVQGFRHTAFFPCYGMAEATLFISGEQPNAEPFVKLVDQEALELGNACPALAGGRSLALVGCGQVRTDHKLAIVDPQSCKPLPDGRVGEIWFRGASIAKGYWGQETLSQEVFEAQLDGQPGETFLRTGDLGFCEGNELFITGRLKDLIIIRGRNYYPQDIEMAAERAFPGMRAGCGAAFSLRIDQQEQVVIVQEVSRTAMRRIDFAAAIQAVRRAVGEQHALQLHRVVLVRQGGVPKTTSGKVRRRATKQAFLDGTLPILQESMRDNEVEPVVTEMDMRVWQASHPEQRRDLMIEYLRAVLAAGLTCSPNEIDPQTPIQHAGLDSLQTMGVLHRVESETGFVLDLEAMLAGASIADLAKTLSTDSSPAASPEAVLMNQGTPFPLTYNQRSLWFLYRMVPDSAAYHLTFASRIPFGADFDQLRRAFDTLHRRHPALRSTFFERSGEPYQQIQGEIISEWVHLDGRAWSEEVLRQWLQDFHQRRFDLSRRGPMRAAYVETDNGPVLCVSFHHIAVDFWSLSVLANDLRGLLESSRLHSDDGLHKGGVQPQALVAHQQDWLNSRAGRQAERYWLERLAGDVPVLAMPTDRSRPSVHRHVGATYHFEIDPPGQTALERWAVEHRVTVFTALVSLYQAWLHRYTAQSDIWVGTPASARSSSRWKDLVSYCVNPVVLRAQFSPKDTVNDLLKRNRDDVSRALVHQAYPFQRLVEKLAPERDSSRTPLFQAMIVHLDNPLMPMPAPFALRRDGGSLALGPMLLRSLGFETGSAQFDLTLLVAHDDEGLKMGFEYNTDLFEADSAARMAHHFQRFVQASLSQPTATLQHVAMIDENERELLLQTWNESSQAPIPAATPALLALAAKARPDAIALVHSDGQLTHAALADLADRWAGHLRAAGVGPGDRVAVCCHRGPDLIAAIIGVWQLGAAYVPLDPSYPTERIQYTLSDASVSLLITERAFAPDFRDMSCPTLTRDAVVRSPQDFGFSVPPSHALPSHVIYTSGSTGEPKGVMIGHHSVSAMLGWARDRFSTRQFDGLLAATSVCFDLSVFEIFAPLCWGGHVVLADNALALTNLDDRDRVRTVNTVPSAMSALLDVDGLPASVETICLAGEALAGDLAARILRRPGVSALYNLYGPSEDTTYSTWSRVSSGSKPLIGRPLSHTTAYMVGAPLTLVPLGLPGELLLGGAGLAAGYHQRPGLTAAHFVPDPFGSIPGGRLYRTGDRARWRANGQLDYLGRFDHQVKVRGYRMELGEIESCLRAMDGISGAVVTVRGQGAKARLIAYLVSTLNDASSQAREHLQQRLPAFMVPDHLMVLDRIPLTPNGKVDRKKLPDPEDTTVVAAVPPQNACEQQLVDLWSDVLGIAAAGRESHFFRHGGHSLSALRLLAEINAAFGTDLPIKTLFLAPTPALFALQLSVENTTTTPQPVLSGFAGDGPSFPLSYAQERMLFLEAFEDESSAYHMPMSLRLNGLWSTKLLMSALADLAVAHPSLRTCFPFEGDQRVAALSSQSVSLPVIDLRGLQKSQREGVLATSEAVFFQRSFDLERGPLWRVRLVILDQETAQMNIVLHHAIADGWSIDLLMRDWNIAYDARLQGGQPNLPSAKVRYVDIAAWQRDPRQIEAWQTHIDWWCAVLDGAPKRVTLPRHGQGDTRLSATISRTLDADTLQRVQGTAGDQGVTTFAVMLAAFHGLLMHYSGQPDTVVGTPVANRADLASQNVVGLFVNTLPIRAQATEKMSFRQLLQQVHAVVVDGQRHQSVPFERLVLALSPERNPNIHPVFQVMFDFLEQVEEPVLPCVSVQKRRVASQHVKFDLHLRLQRERDGVSAMWEFRPDVLAESLVARMASDYEALLTDFTLRPDQSVLNHSMVDPQYFLAETRVTLPVDMPWCDIASSFANTAKAMADRVALQYHDQVLTYGALLDGVDRLAAHLTKQGITAGDLVGICHQRTPAMVTGMLAVLRCGATYVPIDPAYPADRIAYIFKDSGASYAIADGSATLPRGVQRISPSPGEMDADMAWEPPMVTPNQVSHIIYTSGSTGQPKGVVIRHANVAALIYWQGQTFSDEGLRQVLAATSICFDLSVFEIIGSLCLGGGVLLVENVLALVEALPRHGVTLVNTVPSAIDALVQERLSLPALRAVNLAGEALTRGLADRVKSCWPQITLRNLYGPSEDTTYSTGKVITASGDDPSIGIALPGSRAHVVNASLQLAPLGVYGQLALAGAGLASGYHHQPGLTAARFVPDPFAMAPGQRLYLTGDLARWRDDGCLAFHGRLDHQVKLRGFRVELGEIEASLMCLEAVSEAVVWVRSSPGGDDQLVAFVVGEKTLDAEACRQALQQKLPAYMIPTVFIFLPALPKTPNGKVDRKQLKAFFVQPADTGLVAPQDPLERQLCDLVGSLLGIDRVGTDQDFFRLGGHSILATRLIARVRQQFQVDIPMKDFFQSPTIASVAEWIRNREKEHGFPMDIPRLDREGDLPLSPAQARLWFLSQMDNQVYNLRLALRVDGSLDLQRLERALANLIAEQESLRTRFVQNTAGEPRQIIEGSVSNPLRIVETDTAIMAVPAALLTRLTNVRFALENAPLFRLDVVRQTSNRHILLLTIHHIISDGWSLSLFFERLFLHYNQVDQHAAKIAPLPAQYVDVMAAKGGETNHDSWWQSYLADVPLILEIPGDFTRPGQQSHRGGTVKRRIDGQLHQRLVEIQRETGATLFHLLLAAWGVQLSRLTGERSLIIGAPVAGRDYTASESLIGFFLNSLALCVDVEANTTFRKLLAVVGRSVVDAFAHEMPFEKVLSALNPTRDQSRTPIFQVFLNVLNLPWPSVSPDGGHFEPVMDWEEIGANFDLTLYVDDQVDGHRLRLVYDRALFSEVRAEIYLDQLVSLLDAMVGDLDRPVQCVSLRTVRDADVLPDPTVPLGCEWHLSIHDKLAQVAAQRPGHCAVSDNQGSWTYAELDAVSNQVAGHLIARGIQPQDVVAIWAHRSAALVAAIMGTLRAGATFMMMDPAYPANRSRDYLDIGQPKLLIQIDGAEPMAPAVAEWWEPAPEILVIHADQRLSPSSAMVQDAIPFVVTPEMVAYLSFTSGSTGRPKCIEGRHGSLTHFMDWQIRAFDLREDDRYSLLSGLAHDPLQRDIFTALWTGACICVPDPNTLFMPGELARWARDEHVSIFHLTPAMGRLLTDGSGGVVLPDARRAFFVGDVLTRADVARLRTLAPNIEVVNFYGSTETQRSVGYHPVEIDGLPAHTPAAIPLGKGVPDSQLLILNEAGVPAAVGERGEIHIRSHFLAQGYRGLPDQTAAVFLNNPFTDVSDDRLYRTGDLGAYLPNGAIVFRGRRDFQVKIRGFRVEPGEVAAVLSGHNMVREAVVMPHQTAKRGLQLFAFAAMESMIDGADLQAYLAERLPNFMVPAFVVVMDRLPMTPNGKVDRGALDLDAAEAAAMTGGREAALSPSETALAEIWRDLIGVMPGPNDDFFAIGGHSLLATRLLARVQAKFGVQLPVRTIFETPDLASLSARIHSLKQETGEQPPQPVPRDQDLPLSFNQRRLVFLDKLEPDNPFFRISVAARLRGPLDVAAVQAAFDALVARHEILRTRFPDENKPVIETTANLPVQRETDATDLEDVYTRIEHLLTQPFNLANGPLTRIHLFRMDQADHVLFVTMHHIITDGLSSTILLRDFAALYGAQLRGEPSGLTPLRLQYADYAAWQVSREDLYEHQLTYWRDHLQSVPKTLQLVTDRSYPRQMNNRGAAVPIRIDADVRAGLVGLANAENATLFMAIFSAWMVLLYRWSGQSQLLVGTPTANRPFLDLEAVIGYFVNTVVVAGDLRGQPSYRDLINRMRDTVLDAFEHQDVPYERIVNALDVPRDPSRNPLVQAWFVLHNYAPDIATIDDLAIETLQLPLTVATFDWCLQVVDRDDEGLDGFLIYRDDLFEREIAQQAAADLQGLFALIATNPDAPIASPHVSRLLGDRASQGMRWAWRIDAPTDSTSNGPINWLAWDAAELAMPFDIDHAWRQVIANQPLLRLRRVTSVHQQSVYLVADLDTVPNVTWLQAENQPDAIQSAFDADPETCVRLFAEETDTTPRLILAWRADLLNSSAAIKLATAIDVSIASDTGDTTAKAGEALFMAVCRSLECADPRNADASEPIILRGEGTPESAYQALSLDRVLSETTQNILDAWHGEDMFKPLAMVVACWAVVLHYYSDTEQVPVIIEPAPSAGGLGLRVLWDDACFDVEGNYGQAALEHLRNIVQEKGQFSQNGVHDRFYVSHSEARLENMHAYYAGDGVVLMLIGGPQSYGFQLFADRQRVGSVLAEKLLASLESVLHLMNRNQALTADAIRDQLSTIDRRYGQAARARMLKQRSSRTPSRRKKPF